MTSAVIPLRVASILLLHGMTLSIVSALDKKWFDTTHLHQTEKPTAIGAVGFIHARKFL